MNARMRCLREGASGAFDVSGQRTRQRRDDRPPDFAGNGADGSEVALRCDGEARFQNVDAQRVELPGEAKLPPPPPAPPPRLLAVPPPRVEHANHGGIAHLQGSLRACVA
jgi:hypothetical protein